MTESDYARTLDELERLLNDPDVPLRPGLIWRLLDKVSQQDLPGGTIVSRIMDSGPDIGPADVQGAVAALRRRDKYARGAISQTD